MTYEESVEQLENLIESWQLNEADLNQTDIDAIKVILKENQELKKQLENNSKINVSDHKYASECEDKVIVLETQQKEFIKYLEDENKKIYRDGGLRQNIFRQILQKYKEITGSDKE
ncbi:MAG: hypothetical protein Q4E39_05140 [bacterium]|nr:hypothetical protein [bacterium]